MNELTQQRKIAELSKEYGFTFTKSLGQNFLVDNNILSKIIDSAKLTDEDIVFEIGTGVGVLTKELANKSKRVVAIEIDTRLLPILSDTLKNHDNVVILNQDILEVDIIQLWKEYGNNRPIKIVANLPYYITTAIIMRFLEAGIPVDLMILMVQKEVGQRLSARPSTKEYGSLSVAVQYYCRVEKLFLVSKNSFMPQPKIDSLVIRLAYRQDNPFHVQHPQLFFKLIKGAFSKRRKTIVNSLEGFDVHFTKENILLALQEARINSQRRGESLTIEDYANLSNVFFEIVSNNPF